MKIIFSVFERPEYWIKNISGNVVRNVPQNWHQKCTSQKKPNDTHSVVSMETLLAPASFCQKPNILIFNPSGCQVTNEIGK